MGLIRVPDAILHWRAATPRALDPAMARAVDRMVRAAMTFEQILGGRAWIRKQPGNQLFVTRDPADTLLFGKGHPRSGQSRYRWEHQADGSSWGYLVDGADE